MIMGDHCEQKVGFYNCIRTVFIFVVDWRKYNAGYWNRKRRFWYDLLCGRQWEFIYKTCQDIGSILFLYCRYCRIRYIQCVQSDFRWIKKHLYNKVIPISLILKSVFFLCLKKTELVSSFYFKVSFFML